MLRVRRQSVLAISATVLTITSMSIVAEGGPHWSYTGRGGPANWGDLETDYSSCRLGKDQSPIDIRDAVARKAELPAIAFDYQPSILKIIDNGHSMQINYEPGSFISVGGHRYELVQFHFHKPSEERLNGKSFDMVAHLVHRDMEGKLAVLAVLLAKGGTNALIQTLWSNLPNEKEKEKLVESVKIDANELLPAEKAYYTFTGSLTTPPCSEGVTWFVLRNPSSISAQEIARFGESYPMNARPVQPLNGRQILASK